MATVPHFSDEEARRVINFSGIRGFTGETCPHCGEKANVLAGHLGWQCRCGHLNHLDPGNRPLHEHPGIGLSRSKLREIEQRRSERGVQQVM